MPFPYHNRVHCDVVPAAPALTVLNLSAAYPGTRRLALKGVSLTVAVGARVALVGHNGAGKSTLLKVAAGLLPAAEGEVLIYGNPVGACHHRVAYLPQRGEIDWRFPITLRRLVLTGRYVHLGWFARPADHDKALADDALREMGLWALRDRQIGQLSGGQQQRALLARALAQDADLLLLDEPLNAVDGETRAAVEEVLRGLRARRKTVVTATHDLGRLEADFDGALYLADGEEVTPPPGGFVGTRVGMFA
ncbi:MAG: ATP-binding cassette domain-containing protein [Chloroflexota bacterium]|nr:ATP-binding cassette domain-containing protein [Chloroflexota bacterium]